MSPSRSFSGCSRPSFENRGDMRGTLEHSVSMHARLCADPKNEPPTSRLQWEALIARHGHTVLLALLARGVRLDRARELLQETWARLFERAQQGRFDSLELPGLAITQAMFLAAEDGRRD